MANTPERIPVEVSQVKYEIRTVFGVAAEQADVLESLSACANDALMDVYGDSNAALLRQRAHRLRGVAMQSAGVALELAAQAGRLEALAFVKSIIDVARDDDLATDADGATAPPSRARAPRRRTLRRR